jgi:excisionase family DNA binding protein
MGEKLALTIAETAVLLDISERSVQRQIKAGRIPAVHYGRSVRVPAFALRQSLGSYPTSDERWPA